MKTKHIITTLIVTLGLSAAPALYSAETEKDHDLEHAHGAKAEMPNGGRLVDAVEPHFELLVTAERKLQVTFLGEDGKAIAPAAQEITATGGSRSKPTKFVFKKSGSTLVSDEALPEGMVIPLVMRVKPAADTKSVTVRVSLNLADCPSCEHKEYACVCEH